MASIERAVVERLQLGSLYHLFFVDTRTKKKEKKQMVMVPYQLDNGSMRCIILTVSEFIRHRYVFPHGGDTATPSEFSNVYIPGQGAYYKRPKKDENAGFVIMINGDQGEHVDTYLKIPRSIYDGNNPRSKNRWKFLRNTLVTLFVPVMNKSDAKVIDLTIISSGGTIVSEDNKVARLNIVTNEDEGDFLINTTHLNMIHEGKLPLEEIMDNVHEYAPLDTEIKPLSLWDRIMLFIFRKF